MTHNTVNTLRTDLVKSVYLEDPSSVRWSLCRVPVQMTGHDSSAGELPSACKHFVVPACPFCKCRLRVTALHVISDVVENMIS